MKYGWVKVAAVTPKIKVADCAYNVENLLSAFDEADKAGARVAVSPELGITGCTCGDLFAQEILLSAAEKALLEIKKTSRNRNLICFAGLPLRVNGIIYNVYAAVCGGKILGLVPKDPSEDEICGGRIFGSPKKTPEEVVFDGETVLFGRDLLFVDGQFDKLKIGVVIGSEFWSEFVHRVEKGCSLTVHPNAVPETAGRAERDKNAIAAFTKRFHCGFISAGAGPGESTTDSVFGGSRLIAEDGEILADGGLFTEGVTFADIDFDYLERERKTETGGRPFREVEFSLPPVRTNLSRVYKRYPFLPEDGDRDGYELILKILTYGLKKRLEHVDSSAMVVGVSGGLDSALTLLVAARARKLLKSVEIIGVTMPGSGTTERTYENARALIKLCGAQFRKISIKSAVKLYLKRISHDGTQDTVYENAQVRERTRILMDIANAENGLVLGTGDMSELALGWTTYNGDHMSMYSTNSSVPKTLVRKLVEYEANRLGGKIGKILKDISDTPISPELLPPDGGEITQKTEAVVGPYELTDFFLYHTVRNGFSPEKILIMAESVFKWSYDREALRKWLGVFLRRFFSQQYKRSCLPNGVKTGPVSLSPRGEWQMPSDASAKIWLADIE